MQYQRILFVGVNSKTWINLVDLWIFLCISEGQDIFFSLDLGLFDVFFNPKSKVGAQDLTIDSAIP